VLRSTNVLIVAVGIILVGALSSLTPSASLADDSVTDELRRCASVDDASSRLACYDKLGGRQASTPETIAAPAEVGESVALPPDELGSESLHQADDKKDEDAPVIAKVNRCVKDARKKYVFYLEGGQVWKQVSDKKLFYKECAFNVTISKDFFGYKMQVDGEKYRFRVSRIR
jgi:hypothetical protein